MKQNRRGQNSAQLDFTALLPDRLEIDLSDRSRHGINIRLKGAASAPAAPMTPVALPHNVVFPSASEPTAVYSGMRVVNGRVIREGRHDDSQWKYAGLAGAVPRRIYDYDLDVVLERRADVDGVVRLLPVQDAPGEPIRDLEYVIVDVETTGLGYGYGHRITEVAIVRVNGAGRVLDDFVTLVNPERPIPRDITHLTGISSAMVRRAPRFREIAADLYARLDGPIFVAHNAGFDWRFLSLELQNVLGRPLRGRMLCTVRMARKLVPEMPRRSLDALAWHFGITNEARHRASGDAHATAQIFRLMLDRLEERSISGWNELQKLLYARAPRRVRRSSPHFFDPLS